MEIRGPAGELRWGYFPAATLGPWVTDGRTLRAPLRASHSLYLARRPLTLTLAFGRRELVWADIDVQVAGGRVVVTRRDPLEA